MESENQFHRQRLQRLQQACGDVQVIDQWMRHRPDLAERPWIALVCSRLGNDTPLHGEVCRFLARSMLDCRVRQGVLLVADGSAAEPWALRAAELFGVDAIRINVDGQAAADDVVRVICQSDATISRDAAVIALADRVDAAYVRPRGTIARCLKQRLLKRRDASTRVAVIKSRKSAARELIDEGAIGWFVNHVSNTATDQLSVNDRSNLCHAFDPPWTRTDGEWLVHCTRTCVGPWPGQTIHQYQDSMLLDDDGVSRRTPLDSLKRILRTGRLVANAITSAKAWPVVCFSEAPLRELLDERCFRPHLKRWDYEPYGVAIRKGVALDLGLKPVIYGQPDQRRQFANRDQFRFQATGKTYDWRREREWRSPCDVDLKRLNSSDVRVFVANSAEAATLDEQFEWQVDVVTCNLEKSC